MEEDSSLQPFAALLVPMLGWQCSDQRCCHDQRDKSRRFKNNTTSDSDIAVPTRKPGLFEASINASDLIIISTLFPSFHLKGFIFAKPESKHQSVFWGQQEMAMRKPVTVWEQHSYTEGGDWRWR